MTTNGFTIRNDLQDLISIGAFKTFAKKNGIDYHGVKVNVIRNIILAVRNEELEETALRNFLKEQLWYGKNKHVFFIEAFGETIEDFKYTESLLEYFSNRGIQPFNNLDRLLLPDGSSLARFEYDTNPLNDSLINKVYLGFVEKNYTYHFVDQSPVFDAINTYICIELDLTSNMVILKVRSQKSLKSTPDINSNNVTANFLAKKYLEKLTQEYGFEYLDGIAEEIKNTMFNIEKSLTSFIQHQFQPKVIEHSALIKGFTTEVAQLLGLPSDDEPIDLHKRIMGLLERALIVNNEDVIKEYQEGKIGYVNMFDFRDDKGGRINARSKHKTVPIQTSDIFFDTRETINEVKLLDSLWVVWFMTINGDIEDAQLELEVDSDDDDESLDSDTEEVLEQGETKIIKVKTKIAAYKGFYKVEFKRYLTKEEYDHVLSTIESFKG
ncbi:hypothetical protein BMWSH_5057 [Priestia megaterium WSH-002]|uniref:Uncharacterized protein n=1 Tax=Priestia megaterium (strain WSH-002) TaxID=1006007 RepID=A0A8D3X6V2_PRIMW|nr:hypothetical protein [Priestia megaterium]AEN91935.1 hypothetical protein BMWSH_5057 [Priestia megaterium WSH-002]